MKHKTVASTYAEALFDIARKSNTLDQLEKELTILNELVVGNEEFNKLFSIFPFMVSSFMSLSNEAKDLADATVITATTISDSQLGQIRTTFKELIGKDLRITTEIDPGIIGGFVVRIGERVYDHSIKTQLDSVKSTLHEGQVGR